MKRNTLCASYISVALSVFCAPVMAADMTFDSSLLSLDSSLTVDTSTVDTSTTGTVVDQQMDDVTIRMVEEDDSSSAAVLSLPANADGHAVEHATREGYGLSKANSMLDKHDVNGAVGGLAEAISVANEHAKEALQNAMDARDMHNAAKEEHGMAGMHGKAGDHKPK